MHKLHMPYLPWRGRRMKKTLKLVINCDALMIMIVNTEHWYFNIEASYLKLMGILMFNVFLRSVYYAVWHPIYTLNIKIISTVCINLEAKVQAKSSNSGKSSTVCSINLLY